MNKTALAQLFYRETTKLTEGSLAPGQKADGAYKMLHLLFVEMTKAEKLQFTTLFSRIAYVSQKHALSRGLQYFIHRFRKGMTQGVKKEEREAYDLLGIKILLQTIEAFLGKEIPKHLLSYVQQDRYACQQSLT